MVPLVIACLVAYGLGAIPTAYLITRLLRGVDIRTLGDGNMGASNVWREVHPLAGLVVGLVDIGKGALAIGVARVLDLSASAMVAISLIAVAGHAWPVFLQFWGGGGAATTGGVMLALLPRETLMGAVLTLSIVLLTGRHNVGVVSGLGFLSLLAFWRGEQSAGVLITTLAVPSLMGVRVLQQVRAKRARALAFSARNPAGTAGPELL